jgi:hypothetical protein
MKNWFKRNAAFCLGALLGSIAGYVYYLKIGCVLGTCMISSRPLNSSLYGALMGALIGGMFIKKQSEQPDDHKPSQ